MIAELFTNRRKEIGMSLDMLVECSGVPKGTLSKILTGVTPNPTLENAKAIAYALGLTLADLDDHVEADTLVLDPDIAYKYLHLDERGKSVVRAVLNAEYECVMDVLTTKDEPVEERQALEEYKSRQSAVKEHI